MKQDFTDKEFETTMDALISVFERLPTSSLKVIKPEKYKRMLETAARLVEFLRKTIPIGECSIEINDKFNLGAISVELDMLSVDKPLEFVEILSKADNFEICPLCNGKICLDITFQGVLKTVI